MGDPDFIKEVTGVFVPEALIKGKGHFPGVEYNTGQPKLARLTFQRARTKVAPIPCPWQEGVTAI